MNQLWSEAQRRQEEGNNNIDFIIHAGDATQSSTPHQILSFVAAISKFQKPVIIARGYDFYFYYFHYYYVSLKNNEKKKKKKKS